MAAKLSFLFLLLDLIQEPKELWNMYMKTTTVWLDILCVFPFEIFCFVHSGSYDRWIAATLLRSNRMFKMYKVRERHLRNLECKKSWWENIWKFPQPQWSIWSKVSIFSGQLKIFTCKQLFLVEVAFLLLGILLAQNQLSESTLVPYAPSFRGVLVAPLLVCKACVRYFLSNFYFFTKW